MVFEFALPNMLVVVGRNPRLNLNELHPLVLQELTRPQQYVEITALGVDL